MEERLANELLDAMNNTGASVKRKKICTRWLKQIKHLLTIASNQGGKSNWLEKKEENTH